MHPARPPPPPQNRSCPSPSVAPCPSPSPSLIQQQQQHVIYGPITTFQHCPANIHPHCIYTGVHRNPVLPVPSGPLTNQGTKWQPKGKPPRGHQHQQSQQHHQHHHHHHHQPQYCQPIPQQQVQQPLSYIPKPLVIYDQCSTNQSTLVPPPPGTSFLVASSAFANGPYLTGEPYASASGLTLIPHQPYFKPPDVPQTFCLLPERPRPSQPHQQSVSAQNPGTYYNISATNSRSLQTINPKPAFQLASSGNPYGSITAYGSGQINAGHAVPPGQIFHNQPVTINFGPSARDKLSMVANVDVQALTCSGNLTIPGSTKQSQQHLQSVTSRPENMDWSVQTPRETTNNIFEVSDTGRNSKFPSSPIAEKRLASSTIANSNRDERCSDESATSFDFTIEAEKMVSELCNTVSSNDIAKDDNNRVRNDNKTSFSGAAGDNVTNKTNIWFADFCTEYGVTLGQNYRNSSTQTLENSDDVRHQSPDLMRKTIYWGCNEAENILNSGNYRSDTRAGWLGGISCATKTAVTKSSTCFPIFAGDQAFVEDLINAHLRISNGWLVLDNYLNKQHYPSLNGKFEGHLTRRFRNWEFTTNELLTDLVKTFVKVEANNERFNGSVSLENDGRTDNQSNGSIPGDVCLYTNYDLFDSSQRHRGSSGRVNKDEQNDRDATYTLQYTGQSASHPNVRSIEAQQPSQKETKLRSKWTITENLSSTIDSVKSLPDISQTHNDHEFPGGNRFRVKNVPNTRHSLNAEFFHLRNKVMESMENCEESERQRWGVKKHRYDFIFETATGQNGNANVTTKANEPIYKIRTAGTTYENAWTQRCPGRMDSTVGINSSAMNQCGNTDRRVYVVSAAETAMDSTYTATGPTSNRNKTYVKPDYTASVGSSDCTGNNCATASVASSATISNVKTNPVYVGKSSASQRELSTVPRTKMTLLSQIEGNTPTGNTKEMTANLSAWFASIRNSTGHRTITCPIDSRKNDNSSIVRTSSHPQETSRSAIDLNRQLHMDGNRQLQTLQNMQTIQSQPWNACNLLNNKRGTTKIHHHDEYDSSEDVRVYMKPGSYNVPRKRHNRKNNRRGDNPGSSRINNHESRGHNNRGGSGIIYNSSIVKNNEISGSLSTLVIATSVQLSTTTTTTNTVVKLPVSMTPTLTPPSSFTVDDSAGSLRRVRCISNRETSQDVAWKAACASAEILLEALNVKEASESYNRDSGGRENVQTSTEKSEESDNRCSDTKKSDEKLAEADLYGPSSYEASEDDSDSTCKLSQRSEIPQNVESRKQPKTNVKTDFWLIRTLNNASIVSKINTEESDAASTIGESLNGSINDEQRREHQTVVTSTPEPIKQVANEDVDESMIVGKNLDDSFREQPASPRESLDRSTTSSRPGLSMSLIDTSRESIGRATYSETVRRSAVKCCSSGKKDSGRSRSTRSGSFGGPTIRSSIIPLSGKKSQRRENDKTFQMLRKSGKRLAGDHEEKDDDGSTCKRIVKEDVDDGNSGKVGSANTQTRKKEEMGSRSVETKWKPTDRGWSVWYSSRRRQSLSPLALNKLATIHQTVWQMEGAHVLKYPSASLTTVGSLSGTIEDYCKIIKSPMFLETIGYKLKNRIYHKVEHVIRDFRRIIKNSKLYHKNDTDRMASVDALSKKLEDLFLEHFANWDFENAMDSPKDVNSCNAQASRYKSPQKHQKSSANRLITIAKKNSAACSKNEN